MKAFCKSFSQTIDKVKAMNETRDEICTLCAKDFSDNFPLLRLTPLHDGFWTFWLRICWIQNQNPCLKKNYESRIKMEPKMSPMGQKWSHTQIKARSAGTRRGTKNWNQNWNQNCNKNWNQNWIEKRIEKRITLKFKKTLKIYKEQTWPKSGTKIGTKVCSKNWNQNWI